MSNHCFIPLRGKRLRITRLDSCGRLPAAGTPSAFIVTKGFITISLSAEVEEGQEIVQKNANGDLCVNERDNSSFKRFGVEMNFCGVNPELLSMISNVEVYRDYAGNISGFTVSEGKIDKNFASEMWTGLANQPCADGVDEASGYMVLPFVAGGVIGDFEINGENAINFTVTGAITKGGNTWGVGPYQVVYDTAGKAAFLPTALETNTHFLLTDTGLAVPPDSCDSQTMVTAGTSTTAATTTTTTQG